MMKQKSLIISDLKFVVKIHFENRTDSSVSIGRKTINIRIPQYLNRDERMRKEIKLLSWAKKKLQKNIHKIPREIKKEYCDGQLLELGVNKYTLNIDFKEKHNSSVRIIKDNIYLSISSKLNRDKQNKHISILLSRIIASDRLPDLKQKIDELNREHFNQKVNKIFFKNNKSNWGSCSNLGNINISTRLLFAPNDVLEYICIHELAHLIEHNHSARFWKLVKDAMPKYKEKEKWLKENREKCIF